jgi:winged helix-turn-helix DNA-binding protein
MSLVDELRQVEQQVTRRLKELEPLVAEYQQLREIAERIGGQVARAVKAPASQGRKAMAARGRSRGRTRQTSPSMPASGPPAAAATSSAVAKRATTSRRRTAAKPAAARRAGAAAKPAGAGAKTAAARGAGATGKTAAQAAKPTSNGRTTGKHDQQIVRLVKDQPGITIAQVGKQLGVDPTGLYRVVRRLEATGQLSKEGTGLKPAAR